MISCGNGLPYCFQVYLFKLCFTALAQERQGFQPICGLEQRVNHTYSAVSFSKKGFKISPCSETLHATGLKLVTKALPK